MSRQQDQIITAAAGKVAEPIVAAVFAKPRGATMAATGGGLIGGLSVRKQTKAAEEAGLALGNPGAVALTATSLVTMQVKVSMTGEIKEVVEVLATVPLTQVDGLEVKRMGLGGLLRVSARGATVTLEGKLAALREFAESFAGTRSAAPAD